MCLYPAGRGTYSYHRIIGSFLSLFLTNIEGEYHAISKKGNVNIDRSAQKLRWKTLSETITETWKSGPEEGNEVELGFQRFVPSSKLNTRAYIVDDTIFVQAKFDMPTDSVGGDRGVRTSRFPYPALPLPVRLSPGSRPI